MRHFYKHVLSGIVFWLLFSQSLSLFNSSSAASTSRSSSSTSEVAETEDEAELSKEMAVTPKEVEEADDKEEEGSEGRDFSELLKIVKREISDGETGRSSSGIFNTTLAFTIPLFSFSLPDRATAGKDYTKQAALSLFGLAIVGGIAIMPYVWAARPALGKKTVVESPQSREDDKPSEYQRAAEFGRQEKEECERRYRCAFSLIGAANFLFSYFLPPSTA